LPKHVLLVDYENVPRIDLSDLDESYSAIVFVGATQQPPRAARSKATAHRFKRVTFQKILGSGKNALDFHIAFELGRIYETSRDTICVVVSRDKGFDPLLAYLKSGGLQSYRVGSTAELCGDRVDDRVFVKVCRGAPIVTCSRCQKSVTIELHGGRWCVTCGRFATPPDPTLLPSNQPSYREPLSQALERASKSTLECGWCHQAADMADGIYDDGEWMCGACVSRHI
jgi:hypothetical protein